MGPRVLNDVHGCHLGDTELFAALVLNVIAPYVFAALDNLERLHFPVFNAVGR